MVQAGRGGVGTRDRARGSPYDYSLGIYSLSTGTFPARGPPYSPRLPSRLYTYSMEIPLLRDPIVYRLSLEGILL